VTKTLNTTEREPFLSRRVMLGAAVVATAGLAISLVTSRGSGTETVTRQRNKPKRTTADLMKPGPLPDLSIGKADAPVTIVEYASMTCPHCAAFHNTVLPVLKEKYIDTGKVRLVFRDFPLDNVAFAAAMLTRCVNDLAYFAMVDTLFKQQEVWHVQNGIGQVATIAKSAGMDEAAFNACISDQARKAKIVASQKEAADAFKVESTPTFFINDRKLSGVGDYAPFKTTIDAALEAAQ
jgi:protein-disulfide isomerase